MFSGLRKRKLPLVSLFVLGGVCMWVFVSVCEYGGKENYSIVLHYPLLNTNYSG